MKLLRKIPKEIYIYIAWGILVGAVNLGSAWVFMYKCGINEIYANYMSWILYNYVSFATNRKSVFHTKAATIKAYFIELGLFYLSRISTLLIETGDYLCACYRTEMECDGSEGIYIYPCDLFELFHQ